MSGDENNLLLRLHKWARRQDENFHTEALVHLLRHLLQNEPVAATNILKGITGEVLDLVPAEMASVNINTQVSTLEGIPDIEIKKVPDHLVYVEVKVEAELGELQLESYREALTKSGFKRMGLILLTKFSVTEQIKAKCNDTLRWYQIAEWLECELAEKRIQQPLSIYLVEQFLEFLKQRGLIVEKVSKQLIEGIQSLLNLLVMLEKALNLIRAKSIEFDIQSEWVGYFFKFDTGKYWIGLRYDRPQVLLVEEKTDKASYEQIASDKYYWGDDEYWYLRHERDLSRHLSSEGKQFFELLKSGQLQYIEQFITESLDVTKGLQATPAEEIIS
jgi:hypothetical protein